MTAPTDVLQIAAALCENVYRRDNADQQIQFSDIGVTAVPGLLVRRLGQSDLPL